MMMIADDDVMLVVGGYHPVYIGETFKEGRYTVLHKLGWGHFSTVWLVADARNDGLAALKVVKSAQHYTEAATDEIELLSRIKECDPENRYHCCRLLDTFKHYGIHGKHVCMVFEVLGDNLLSLIRHYDHKGIPLDIVKHLSKQILEALHYMHEKCGIIHTDLKPENVMLNGKLKKSQEESIASAIKEYESDSTGWRNQNKGKIAKAIEAGKPLTKNQKKKLRKKQQKKNSSSSSCPQSATEAHHAQSTVPPAEIVNKVDFNKVDQLNGQLENCNLSLEDRLLNMECKIVDFGNACWTDRHFTDDIQTRQYRAPEVCCGTLTRVYLGVKWVGGEGEGFFVCLATRYLVCGPNSWLQSSLRVANRDTGGIATSDRYQVLISTT